MFTGDLGISRSFNQPVSQVISERLPWTLLLVGISLLIAILASLTLGVLAGIRSGGFLDKTVSGLSVVVQGLPPFVLSLGAIALFALTLGWLPVAGLTDGGCRSHTGTGDPALGPTGDGPLHLADAVAPTRGPRIRRGFEK